MTALSSLLAESTFGEKCALYLNSVAGVASLQSLRHRLATALTTKSLSPLLIPVGRLSELDWLSSESILPFTLLSGLLLAILAAVAVTTIATTTTMSWFWRRSPYNSSLGTTPQVKDGDFSYITSDDIVEPHATATATARPPAPTATATARPRYGVSREISGDSSESDPDVLILKHRGNTYPLHFPAYAIDDGILTVRELRQRAAEKTGGGSPSRIRLLYKGKLLKDDSRPCKLEGLKQNSEVLCVVSEVQSGESSPSDDGGESETTSDVDGGTATTTSSTRNESPGGAGTAGGAGGGKKKKKRSKGKKNKKGSNTQPTIDPHNLAPPMDNRPSSSGRSSAPSPAPSLKSYNTPREQVQALAAYFRAELLPLCEGYMERPPADAKARDFEHKKLTETIFAQIMLKADGIEPNGDEEARTARRALIKEVQATLARLDRVGNDS